MKYLLQLFFLCFVTVAQCQHTDTINRIDENGLKQGLWIKYYDKTTSVKSKGFYVDNQPEGRCETYYESGQLKGRFVFKSGNYFGPQIHYYENGKPNRIQYYSDQDEQIDSTLHFSPSGRLISKEIPPKNNHLHISIGYKSNESTPDTTITVISDTIIKSRYTLLLDFKLAEKDSLSSKQFIYKHTYETTPIFQEYLLTLYNDSTYFLVMYNYQSCYNTLHKSYGTWNTTGSSVQLTTLNGFSFNHTLENNDWKELISAPQVEWRRMDWRYVFHLDK